MFGIMQRDEKRAQARGKILISILSSDSFNFDEEQ